MNFTANGDETNIPLEYQDVIVHKAVSYWALREENVFRYQDAQQQFKDLKDKMTNDPRMMRGFEWELPAIGAD